jgi:hypothetical protein
MDERALHLDQTKLPEVLRVHNRVQVPSSNDIRAVHYLSKSYLSLCMIVGSAVANIFNSLCTREQSTRPAQ